MSVESTQFIGSGYKASVSVEYKLRNHILEPLLHDDGASLPAELTKLLSSAQQALGEDSKDARQLVAKVASLLKVEVERREAKERGVPPEQINRHLAPWQSRRIVEFVEENLACTIRIDDLAAIARISARQLSRAFRFDFGESAYGYVVRRRIERAKEMMVLSDEPLANIAAKCGLSDQPHLTRLFRRIVGESPARWRQHAATEWPCGAYTRAGRQTGTPGSPTASKNVGDGMNPRGPIQ
jgi:AraC-like DNA-binding protein